MLNHNYVSIAGNLGADPEVRYMPSGQAVASFPIAVTKKWTKEGEKKEKTSWFDVEIFGKVAENIGKYTGKGCNVMVYGELEESKWETSEGQKRSKVKIKAFSIKYITWKSDHDKNFDEQEVDIPF